MPIEQLRSLLVIALCVVLFLLWTEWQRDYGPKPAPVETAGTPVPAETPTATDIPLDAPDLPVTAADDAPALTAPAAEEDASPRAIITVRTDLIEADIDLEHGTIISLRLIEYPVTVEEPDIPFDLLHYRLPSDIFIAQSGLLGGTGNGARIEGYRSDKSSYVLDEGADSLDVPLVWNGPDGVTVTKTYTFTRDRYLLTISHTVDNGSDKGWKGRMFGQLQRTPPTDSKRFIYTFTGGVFSSADEPYEKIDFDEMQEIESRKGQLRAEIKTIRDRLARVTDPQEKQRLQDSLAEKQVLVERTVVGGWVAMIQHYFASAWIPDPNTLNHYYTQAKSGERYSIGVSTPTVTIAPGESETLQLSLYSGPKVQKRLEKAAPGLNRTVDYGYLWFIAQPLFQLWRWIHEFLGNWGWSIIVLTIIIKLAFFHLSAASYKSMARMRNLQPRMVQLRERFGDDKQRLNQAMMELYKKEKINPLGGCLPILVQIPVFISLYWVLLESVELRQAPFALWIRDMATHDPYFVLPILMGITMFAQQRLNPAPPDPIQAKIMMALPIVFTFFFLFFPAGLVLYWFVNNLLSIAQQWVITKRIAKPVPAKT